MSMWIWPLLLLAAVALAGDQDEIRLNDGTVIYGTILVLEPGSHVSIRDEDGKERVLNWATIESVVRADSNGASDDVSLQPQRQHLLDGGLLLTHGVGTRLVGVWHPPRDRVLVAGCLGEIYTETQDQGSAGGGGLGAAVDLGFMYLTGASSVDRNWGFLAATIGLEGDALGISYYAEEATECQATFDSAGTTMGIVRLPAHIGGHLGLGKVVLGLSYTPGVWAATSRGRWEGGPDWAALEFSVDFVSLERVVASESRKGRVRASLGLVAPTRDGDPYRFSIGIGSVSY